MSVYLGAAKQKTHSSRQKNAWTQRDPSESIQTPPQDEMGDNELLYIYIYIYIVVPKIAKNSEKCLSEGAPDSEVYNK